MEESYILVLLTILILLVVIVGYFGQKKMREMELSTNALKCDFETHTEHVNNILLQQNNTIGGVIHGGNITCNELNHNMMEQHEELDLSKLQNIMSDDYEVLNQKNNEIYKNLNSNLKCIDDSDNESLIIENNTELLGDDSDDDSDNDNFSSDSDEETLPSYDIITTDENVVEKVINENVEEAKTNEEATKLKTVDLNNTSKKKERRVPNQVASKFNGGHEIISENDGKLYKVVEYNSGKKRWVLAK
jgi:hypothetical protein